MQGLRDHRGRLLTAVPFGLAVLGTLVYAVWLAVDKSAVADPIPSWVYDGTILMAGASCLIRAAVAPDGRGPWIAFGLGLVSWAAGDIYWTQALGDLTEIPYPSLADLGYLLALPCLFVGVALLIKRRVGRFTLASWIDGLIAALAAAALGSAFLAPALIGLTEGDPAVVATNLAYPLGDLILIAFITGALVVSGVRGAASILAVGFGLLVWCFADVLYLYQTGTDTYVEGWTDLLWPAGAVLIAASAQFSDAARTQRTDYISSVVPPVISTLGATGILVWDHFSELPEGSNWLAGATILAATIRLAVSFRENTRLTRALHGEASTDALTGLGNRRKLLQDLAHAFEPSSLGNGRRLFAMFDLDGFKAYNDSYGHPAGDALLQRLGAKLARAAEEVGTAYRLGGDEFCVLAEGRDSESTAGIVEAARAALSEEGEGFEIGASGGSVLLLEAADTSDVLHLADQRMYAEKNQRTTRSARQTQDLLIRILEEHDPTLGIHMNEVSVNAVALCAAISLPEPALNDVELASKLHDIGKIAIPDSVLLKRGPLDEIDWKLMERHTVIGERILSSTPGLQEAGRLVRSTHERWDGTGYPDGLAGKEIPLGSRIIFISDSYDAMTSERPYRESVSQQGALAELRRCAGTQFDPELVEAFCELIESGSLTSEAEELPRPPARPDRASAAPSASRAS